MVINFSIPTGQSTAGFDALHRLRRPACSLSIMADNFLKLTRFFSSQHCRLILNLMRFYECQSYDKACHWIFPLL